MAPPKILPPVMFPLTDTVVPDSKVAFTLAPPNTLPPVILPVADINPAVSKLPPVALPVTAKLVKVPTLVMLVCAAVATVPIRFPPVMLPVVDMGFEPNAAKLAATLALP